MMTFLGGNVVKSNNKGFSLIELIIVIAIMAVLVAIIAPNLTKYLGKSKEQTDLRNLDETKHQVLNAISDASTRLTEIPVFASGNTKAVYILEYDNTLDSTQATSSSGGDANFAALLSDVFKDADTKSAVDKNFNKIQITIDEKSGGGISVSVKYVS